jgi:hypothetical protein
MAEETKTLQEYKHFEPSDPFEPFTGKKHIFSFEAPPPRSWPLLRFALMYTPTHRITAPSHPSTCTPTLRISNLHKHHTRRPLHSLLILPSNLQGQTRRLLPHVCFKMPYAKTPHPLNHFKVMTPRREDHRLSTTSMKTITTTTTTVVAQARRLQQRLNIHGGEHRLAARAPSENWDSITRRARKHWKTQQAKHKKLLHK